MKTEIIYFSATGTTKTIVEAISKGLKGDVNYNNVTSPENRKRNIMIDSDLTIIAVPVYGERIPHFVFDFLKNINGNGSLLAVISVYGNVGFGISLEQFEDLAKNNNFKLIAAGTFIGQHTYDSEKAQISFGRPDLSDLKQAEIFGERIQKKIDSNDYSLVKLPKYKLPKFITNIPDSFTRFLIKQPIIIESICNSCGKCTRKCPVGAIDLVTLKINECECLRCYACVKCCPKSARISEFRLPLFKAVFKRAGKKRKENQTFL